MKYLKLFEFIDFSKIKDNEKIEAYKLMEEINSINYIIEDEGFQ